MQPRWYQMVSDVYKMEGADISDTNVGRFNVTAHTYIYKHKLYDANLF